MEYQTFINLLPRITSAYRRLLGLIKRAETWSRKLQPLQKRGHQIPINQQLTNSVLTATSYLNTNRNLLLNLPQVFEGAQAHIEALRAKILPPDAFK